MLSIGVTTHAVQAVETAGQPVQKTFKNWQVTCNNVNDCDVRNDDEELRIILTRKAGADASPQLRFQQWGEGQAAGFWLDGKPWRSDIAIKNTANTDDYDVGSSSKLSDVQQWVQATKNALKISLSATGTGASLSGLNAALLLVDDRQGRLNNQTALLRVGNNEPDAVPDAPEPPTLNFVVPALQPLTNEAALIDGAIAANGKLLAKEYCDQSEETRARSTAQPLNGRQALVLLNCGLGAYQSSSMLFISDRKNPQDSRHLTLPLPINDEQGQPRRLSWFTEGDYDAKTGLLSFSGRGRGIADCGESGSWKFDGKNFHLAQYNSQPTCNGGEPGDWPSVWVSAGTP